MNNIELSTIIWNINMAKIISYIPVICCNLIAFYQIFLSPKIISMLNNSCRIWGHTGRRKGGVHTSWHDIWCNLQMWWFIVINICLIPRWLGIYPRKCRRSLLWCLMRHIILIMCVLKLLVLVWEGRHLKEPEGISIKCVRRLRSMCFS